MVSTVFACILMFLFSVLCATFIVNMILTIIEERKQAKRRHQTHEGKHHPPLAQFLSCAVPFVCHNQPNPTKWPSENIKKHCKNVRYPRHRISLYGLFGCFRLLRLLLHKRGIVRVQRHFLRTLVLVVLIVLFNGGHFIIVSNGVCFSVRVVVLLSTLRHHRLRIGHRGVRAVLIAPSRIVLLQRAGIVAAIFTFGCIVFILFTALRAYNHGSPSFLHTCVSITQTLKKVNRFLRNFPFRKINLPRRHLPTGQVFVY